MTNWQNDDHRVRAFTDISEALFPGLLKVARKPGAKDEPARVREWVEALGPYPHQIVLQGLRDASRESDRRPTISQVLTRVRELYEALRAWKRDGDETTIGSLETKILWLSRAGRSVTSAKGGKFRIREAGIEGERGLWPWREMPEKTRRDIVRLAERQGGPATETRDMEFSEFREMALAGAVDLSPGARDLLERTLRPEQLMDREPGEEG